MRFAWTWIALVGISGFVTAQEVPLSRTEDVIYGRKHGLALVLDVFTPKDKPNGAAIVLVISGGFFSNKEMLNTFGVAYSREPVRRGYTVFAVMHGSQPRFTIPEALDDVHRAVRFIRHHAKRYAIDPQRIGIMGASAGGHLSLMMGTTGKVGDFLARDAVDRESSQVQAVACFFPPTDFLNYGQEGVEALGTGLLSRFAAPFAFVTFDAEARAYRLVTDADKRREIGRAISPVYHVTKSAAPTRIIHGDADKLVPIQQAEIMIEALKKAEVPADLVIKKGAAHGWMNQTQDASSLVDWFDRYLKAVPAK